MVSVEPLCPYFGDCGGCSAQHIEYKTQIENKKNFVIGELQRYGIEFPKDVPVNHHEPYFYRNRMDFIFFENGLGLRRRQKWNKIIPIKKCYISNDKLNKLLEEVWDWFESNQSKLDVFDIHRKRGCLKYAVIRAPENSEDSTISFALNEESTKLGEHTDLIREFAEQSSAKNVVISRVLPKPDTSIGDDVFAVKGDVNVEEILLGKSLKFNSQAFFQNNTKMTEKMIRRCKDIFEKYETEDKFFVDLYGGAGTFGVTIADIFKKTMIIDISAANIEMAKKNIEANSLENAEAICDDASVINKYDIEKKNLFMILDPPRSGMHPKALKEVVLLEPEVLIYISCNPKQLPKDLKKLTPYYDVKSVEVFDLFPQTVHVETVVELTKKP
jgi:23S rRNA (uracil-5-)-methyltransferase RumA